MPIWSRHSVILRPLELPNATLKQQCASWRRLGSLKLQHMRSLYEVKCNGYWRAAISTSKGNSSELWKTLQGVLGEANGEVSDAHTADDFATFFQNKVDSVRSSTATTPLYDVPCRATPTISELAPVTAEEVERMIGSSPNKSCQLLN